MVVVVVRLVLSVEMGEVASVEVNTVVDVLDDVLVDVVVGDVRLEDVLLEMLGLEVVLLKLSISKLTSGSADVVCCGIVFVG